MAKEGIILDQGAYSQTEGTRLLVWSKGQLTGLGQYGRPSHRKWTRQSNRQRSTVTLDFPNHISTGQLTAIGPSIFNNRLISQRVNYETFGCSEPLKPLRLACLDPSRDFIDWIRCSATPYVLSLFDSDMGTTHALSDSEEEVIFNPFDAYFNIGRHLLFRKDYKRALVYLDKVRCNICYFYLFSRSK